MVRYSKYNNLIICSAFWKNILTWPPGIYQGVRPLHFNLVYLPSLTHKCLTRHLGKLEILSVWWYLVVMGSRSLWARWWHSARQLRHSICRSQHSNRVLLPCQMKMACFWCSLFRIEKKMNSLDQRIYTECQELDGFALARRPLWNNICNWSQRFWKYSSPKTSWCLAVAKLNCGRNHCDFTLKTLVVTLLFTVFPGKWYYFLFTILLEKANSNGLHLSYYSHSYPTNQRAIVRFIPIILVHPFQLYTQPLVGFGISL